MKDTGYEFILALMTWSFTRLESFYQCKSAWKRKYVDCEQDRSENAFSQYGSISHKVLEEFLKGQIGMFEMADEYKDLFARQITEPFPYNKSSDLAESYYNKGLKYFEEFTDVFPGIDEVLGVEKKVKFNIEGYSFIGFIDVLAKNKDGKVVVCDHKSASVKFKKNGEPTKKAAEKMEMYKKQLYLYCKALIDQGIKPDILCWNFFNDQNVYMIPFKENEYQDTLKWAVDTIHLIEQEENFDLHDDFYFCHNICEFRHKCECGVQEKDEEEDDERPWETEPFL